MWRTQSFHKKNETEFLQDALRRVKRDDSVCVLADALIKGASESEPLFAEAMQTPQDIRYHAEGPFLHAHIRSILCVLYALMQEKLHLIDIEEFRRLKGYEGEIEELEETIKENVGFFEVFALMHDAAKWASVVFSAPAGSLGAKFGFNAPLTYEFDNDAKMRVKLREAYLELFHEFSKKHPMETAREIQKLFFETYQIEINYPHHDRLMLTPVYRDLFNRFIFAHNLPPKDSNILADLITHHLRINNDFFSVRPQKIRNYAYLAQKRGYDADDFIDLLQGCLFFDMVCGSLRFRKDEYMHDSTVLINCFKSEHDFSPQRRAEKEATREAERTRQQNQLFREVGLDGIALLDLLKMEPGIEFGVVLKKLHVAIQGEGAMPKFGDGLDAVIKKRVTDYYYHAFPQGE